MISFSEGLFRVSTGHLWREDGHSRHVEYMRNILLGENG